MVLSCLVVLCVLLRLNFWFFSGNCRPCLRVVQLPERTTGPTSQETPTTLPAGNEGSQAYSLCYPVCSQGSTGPPGPILRNPTTLPAGNEDSQAYSTSSGNCKTLPAGSTSPRKDHLALFRETSRPCLRVMKAPRGLENSRNPGAPGLPKVSSCHLGNKTSSGIPTV